MRVEILNNLFGARSQCDDAAGALEAVKEIVEVYRKIAAADEANRNG